MEQIRDIFHRHDLRCTKQREIVYTALMATKMHPTAEELHTAVKASEPGMSLATVYNTLEAFTACGLVRRLPPSSGSGASRYDADTHDHVHLTTPDGRVFDIPEDLSELILDNLPDHLLDELERRMQLRVGRVNIQLVASPRDER